MTGTGAAVALAAMPLIRSAGTLFASSPSDSTMFENGPAAQQTPGSVHCQMAMSCTLDQMPWSSCRHRRPITFALQDPERVITIDGHRFVLPTAKPENVMRTCRCLAEHMTHVDNHIGDSMSDVCVCVCVSSIRTASKAAHQMICGKVLTQLQGLS